MHFHAEVFYVCVALFLASNHNKQVNCNETMTTTQISLVKFCCWIQNVSGGALGELIVKRYVANSIATDCRMFRPCRALSTMHKILKKVAEGLAL